MYHTEDVSLLSSVSMYKSDPLPEYLKWVFCTWNLISIIQYDIIMQQLALYLEAPQKLLELVSVQMVKKKKKKKKKKGST